MVVLFEIVATSKDPCLFAARPAAEPLYCICKEDEPKPGDEYRKRVDVVESKQKQRLKESNLCDGITYCNSRTSFPYAEDMLDASSCSHQRSACIHETNLPVDKKEIGVYTK